MSDDKNPSAVTSQEGAPAASAETQENLQGNSQGTSGQDVKTVPSIQTVPYSALYEERQMRKTSEQKNLELQKRISELESPQSPDNDEFTQEQLQAFEKAARKVGLVPVHELEQKQQEEQKQQILNEFLSKNPLYAPANDPLDKNWKTLQEQLSYYNLSSPERFKNALEKAHQELSGNDLKKVQLKANAQAQRNIMASVGGEGGVSQDGDVILTPEEERLYAGWIDKKYILEAKKKRLQKSK